MSTTRHIVTVTAGISRPSSTRMLADRLGEATVEALAAEGTSAEVHVIDLRERAHDVINAMLTGFPSGALADDMAQLAAADAVIMVTPLYATTFSGLFKSFIDVIEQDTLRGKPVLLGATGGTPRHSLALEYAIRPVLSYLHAAVVPTAVFAATDDWAGRGDQVNPLPERISRAGSELAAAVQAAATGRTAAGAGTTADPADPFASSPSFDELLRGA